MKRSEEYYLSVISELIEALEYAKMSFEDTDHELEEYLEKVKEILNENI